MRNRKSRLVAGAVAIAAFVMVASAQAWQPRINYLTFGSAVALPGVALPPGSYTFELAPPTGSLNAVRVTSRDGRQLFYYGLTQVVMRPAGMPQDRTVTFGEAARGGPPPIAAWYPLGSDTGHRFLY